jgi:site-specific recombinase XerD
MEKAFILAKQLYKQNMQPTDLYKRKKVSRDQLFIIAYAYYLLGITNKGTQKQYKTVIDHFIRYMANTRKTTPLETTGIDVSLWREDLIRTGGVAGAPPQSNLSRYFPQEKSSIHVKVSVLSAFFKFLQKPNLDGSAPLIAYNPVQALRTRFQIERYGSSKKIDKKTLSKILKQIDMLSVRGLRDYTLIFGYFLTGRRNTEWVTLTWDQLNFNTDPATYSFVRKGEKKTIDELPESLQNLLLTYLRKRWGDDFHKKIHGNSYLFTAMPGKGGSRQIINPNNPLTERSMLRIVKSYASKAGMDPKRITVHSLRHLHAESYLEAGASVEEVRARLQHQSLATTQRYVSSMQNEKNRLAGKLETMLDITSDPDESDKTEQDPISQ